MEKIMLVGLVMGMTIPQEAVQGHSTEFLQLLAAVDSFQRTNAEQDMGIYRLELPPEPSPFIEPSIPAVLLRERGARENQRRDWIRERNRGHKLHGRVHKK